MRTAAEVETAIDELNVTDEDREIAKMVLNRGWSYSRVAAETGYSVRSVQRRMARVYDRLS